MAKRPRCTLFFVVLLSLGIPCDGQDAGLPRVSSKPLSEQVIRLSVYNQNVGCVRTERGLVFIDTSESPAGARAVRAAAFQHFGEHPVHAVINTHADWDHVFGNQEFRDALLISHETVPAAMREAFSVIGEARNRSSRAEAQSALPPPPPLARTLSPPPPPSGQLSPPPPPPPGGKVVNAPSNASPRLVTATQAEGETAYISVDMAAQFANVELTTPTLTFSDELSMDLGDVNLRLFYYGRGHTKGDLLVVVPEAGVMFSGDVFYQGQLPPLAGRVDLEPDRWIEALDRAMSPGLDVQVVVPGHGASLNRAEMERIHAYIKRLWTEVQAGVRKGSSLADLKRELSTSAAFLDFRDLDVVRAGTSVHDGNVEALWKCAEPESHGSSR